MNKSPIRTCKTVIIFQNTQSQIWHLRSKANISNVHTEHQVNLQMHGAIIVNKFNLNLTIFRLLFLFQEKHKNSWSYNSSTIMVNGYKADHQYLNDASKYLCIYCFKIDIFFLEFCGVG